MLHSPLKHLVLLLLRLRLRPRDGGNARESLVHGVARHACSVPQGAAAHVRTVEDAVLVRQVADSATAGVAAGLEAESLLAQVDLRAVLVQQMMVRGPGAARAQLPAPLLLAALAALETSPGGEVRGSRRKAGTRTLLRSLVSPPASRASRSSRADLPARRHSQPTRVSPHLRALCVQLGS
eukprot:753595-Hanusia_phi.AAC.4